MDLLKKVNEYFKEGMKLKDKAIVSLEYYDKFFEASEKMKMAGDTLDKWINSNINYEEVNLMKMKKYYYYYQENECMSAYYGECRDKKEALYYKEKELENINIAIDIYENFNLEKNSKTERFGQSLYVDREISKISKYIIIAKAESKEKNYIKALDYYKLACKKIDKNLIAMEKLVEKDYKKPENLRILYGNKFGMMFNVSIMYLEILKSDSSLKNDELYYEVINHLISSYEYSKKAYNENPQWNQYEKGIIDFRENLEKILNSIKYMWEKLLIYNKSSLLKDIMKDIDRELYLSITHECSIKYKYENEIEHLIIKELDNAIKLKENDPSRLISLTENQLSNDLFDIVQNTLKNENLIIEREKPGGFSKKSIGEMDFYIYRYNKGVLETLCIGENKIWEGESNFKKQLMQLFGYMKDYNDFGFTIIFNKKNHITNILKKRKKILEEFNEENFNTLKIENIDKSLIRNSNIIVSTHSIPENKKTIKIYHLIVNCKMDERRELAEKARD
jgi:hypothetical protein